MLRRSFVSGLLLAGGAMAGHFLTKGVTGSIGAPMDPKVFAMAMSGLQLRYLSQDLLLMIFSRKVTDSDRTRLVGEVVNHNRNLFVKSPYDRQHGVPGFYRVIE